MKNIYILLLSVLFITACEGLDQSPPNIASADSLTDFNDVLNAAYFYQHGSVTPLAIMGDFRADNALFDEQPYTEFDEFDSGLTAMEDQFFGPFYTALYKSILSANNVITNSTSATQIAEAKFLRGLSYFKLVQVFGSVTVNLSSEPSLSDTSILVRQSAADVYDNVIIPDLIAARDGLSATIRNGRASKYAAQGILGKVYMARGDFANAEPQLAAVVNGASSASIRLQPNFADIFGAANDLNSEIIFSTQISSSVIDEYTFASEFPGWFSGGDSKANLPLDPRLTAAFNASPGDARRAATIDDVAQNSVKYGASDDNQDWIELRLADVILLYAEAINENANTPAARTAALAQLNKIRTRANIPNSTAATQVAFRAAVADERRLELAFEGQRWFDLVRTNTAQSTLGFSNPNYLLFPVPISEVLASFGVITQNTGY